MVCRTASQERDLAALVYHLQVWMQTSSGQPRPSLPVGLWPPCKEDRQGISSKKTDEILL
jgi:hypothetical protein